MNFFSRALNEIKSSYQAGVDLTNGLSMGVGVYKTPKTATEMTLGHLGVGGAVGGVYGAFSDDTSVFKGALAGAAIKGGSAIAVTAGLGAWAKRL